MVGPKVHRFWNVRMNMELMSPDKGQHDFDLINSRAGLRFPHQIHWTDPTVGNVSWWCLGIPNVRHWYIPFFSSGVLPRGFHHSPKKTRWDLNLTYTCVPDWLGERTPKNYFENSLRLYGRPCCICRYTCLQAGGSKKKSYREVKVSEPSEWGAKDRVCFPHLSILTPVSLEPCWLIHVDTKFQRRTSFCTLTRSIAFHLIEKRGTSYHHFLLGLWNPTGGEQFSKIENQLFVAHQKHVCSWIFLACTC